jgi:hypothetical protein
LNAIDVSGTNQIGTILNKDIYVWNRSTGIVNRVSCLDQELFYDSIPTSVKFSRTDPNVLSAGFTDGRLALIEH